LTNPIANQSIKLHEVAQAAGIHLKRSGNRFVGLCPFHAEKNPSFFIFPDGRFKCFGCGAYGNGIDFVQKLYGCDFKEALKALGIEKCGLAQQPREEIIRLRHQQDLVRRFRKWEASAADQAAMRYRCARKVLGNIRSEADLMRVGDLYHSLQIWQHHLEVLARGNDQAKFELWRTQYYECI